LIKRLWQRLFPRHVWLTFDDGPHPELTPRVLDTLRRHGIKATFFLRGDMAAASPAIVERISAEGHSIGNHTFNHLHLPELTRDEIISELEKTRALIAPHQHDWRLFRPPYGELDDKAQYVIEELGYKVHKWTVDPRDWDPESRSQRWVETALTDIVGQRRAIVVMHDVRETTAQHLDTFITRLKTQPTLFKRL